MNDKPRSAAESFKRTIQELTTVWRHLSGRSRGQIIKIIRSDKLGVSMWALHEQFEESQKATAENDEQLLKECFRDDEHGFRFLQVTYLGREFDARYQVNDWSNLVEVPADSVDRDAKIAALKRELLFDVKYFSLCHDCRLRYPAGKMWYRDWCLQCKADAGPEEIY